MKRCSRCIMPETAKGVNLDSSGRCQFCREYKEFVLKGVAKLKEEIEKSVRGIRGQNCVVPVSGGRDSAYALYYAKKVLGLDPVAVHNDNDFETEIASRNLKAITKRLNVQLIRIGTRKRLAKRIVAEKFKMNASFGSHLIAAQACEACKIGFEAAAYKTARSRGIELILWGDSNDESTAGYYELVGSKTPKILQRFAAPNVLSLFAYKYYLRRMKKEYGPHSSEGLNEIHLYDYIRWDPDIIVSTIRRELDWYVPQDFPTTWRVDCSLVPVIDYLVDKAYGVSKIELGFSNMVRNGKMDRGDALRRAEQIKRNTDVNGIKRFLNNMGIKESVVNMIIG